MYIASPHDSHADFASACLDAGKPVLCEKPLTPTLAQTRRLVAQSTGQRVFLMEALWTRFLPLYAQVAHWLQAGAIGELRSIHSSFCFQVPYQAHSRLFDPRRAGGCLLDIGIYNLAVTRWALAAAWGHCPEPSSLQASGQLAPSGVDQHVQARLGFPGGVEASFTCAFDQASDNALRIGGTEGEIRVPRNFWEATAAELLQPGRPSQTAQAPWRVNGFEYEIEAAMQAIRGGLIECPRMPHAESLALSGWLDALRREVGVRYPFERAGA